MAPSPKVWFITACSSGFGREIALAALNRGDHVLATARDDKKISDLAQHGAHTFALDVTAGDETIAAVVGRAVQVYGRIDILVNNAGYIMEGAIEECSPKEVYDDFNTNVFGALSVLRAVLPYMRNARSGVVANIGSIGGWYGGTTAGIYCATKAALGMISESLRAEVAHLGIKVTCIEPGYFRTNFASPGHRQRAEKLIPDLQEALKNYGEVDQKQSGDPAKGAKVIVEALTGSGRCVGKVLPARLLLGRDAVAVREEILKAKMEEMKDWEEIVSSTDFD